MEHLIKITLFPLYHLAIDLSYSKDTFLQSSHLYRGSSLKRLQQWANINQIWSRFSICAKNRNCATYFYLLWFRFVFWHMYESVFFTKTKLIVNLYNNILSYTINFENRQKSIIRTISIHFNSIFGITTKMLKLGLWLLCIRFLTHYPYRYVKLHSYHLATILDITATNHNFLLRLLFITVYLHKFTTWILNLFYYFIRNICNMCSGNTVLVLMCDEAGVYGPASIIKIYQCILNPRRWQQKKLIVIY